MKKIRFRNAALDVFLNEDGTIDAIENNGNLCHGLLYDLCLIDDIQAQIDEEVAKEKQQQ